jgi:hypothetical protein
MRRIGVLAAVLIAALLTGRPSAQSGGDVPGGGDPMDNVTIGLPSFNARLSMGFNYDLLRSMTNVSFQYPVGYLGFNLPWIGGNLGSFLDSTTMAEFLGSTFSVPQNFNPVGQAGQSTNYTVRVDVPMLKGVGTFAYTQNFYMNFNTALGGSSIIGTLMPIHSEFSEGGSVDGFLAVRGALRLPLSFSMGWETMTLGYAYRVGKSDDLTFALNMHRHLFSADIRLKADIDLLGHASINASNIDMGNGALMSLGIEDELINFNSEKCNGFAQGRFRAEGWTPSLGVKWKRVSLNSRFGLDVRAKGAARGGFIIPRVVNLETGDLLLGDKFSSFADSMESKPLYMFSMLDSSGGIIPNEIDSITYEINDPFRWKMPQGHTLAFEIIPQKLSVSYTKLFGEVAVNIDNIIRKRNVQSESADSWLSDEDDTLSVDIGILVDHILVFNLSYPSFFANVGIAGFGFRNNNKQVIREADMPGYLIKVGDVAMLLPILSGGFNLGTKLQLRVEADILPLPAIRSGINYYF